MLAAVLFFARSVLPSPKTSERSVSFHPPPAIFPATTRPPEIALELLFNAANPAVCLSLKPGGRLVFVE